MADIKMGIMGAGGIARLMATTVNQLQGVRLYAIGSRELDRAVKFAEEFQADRAYASYEELVNDPEVDLIYIATPHSEHYANAKLCLEYGKAVLCEKAFTVNAAQARELVALARGKNILLTEAIWTRYMPMLDTIKKVLADGAIGEPVTLTANLAYPISGVKRLIDPALAGGALLDLGVYVLNFASMMFGTQVERIESTCMLTDTGVDSQNSITVIYRDGKMAVLNTTMMGIGDRRGIIYGTKGFAVIENINNYESMTIYDLQYQQTGFYRRPRQINGYEYEVQACIDALKEGKIECDAMPHEETIRIMSMMDEIRAQWGLKYPFET